MHRASQDEEIFNFVSKKLATTQLTRRRSQNSTNHNTSTTSRPSRVEKPSSRHGSPKLHEKRVVTTAPRYMPAMNLGAVQSTDVPSQSRPSLIYNQRSERPYSWHPTSHSNQDATLFPYTAMATAAPLGYDNAWQLSSYEWPGEPQYMNQQLPYDLGGSANTMPHLTSFNTTRYPTVAMDNAVGTYPSWYSQIPGHATMPFYPTGPLPANSGQIQPYPAFPIGGANLYGQPRVTVQSLARTSQNHNHIAQPSIKREADVITLHDPATQEEELVGLGLYDREEDASTLQLCAGLSSSAPNHFGVVASGKGLKLEETWQPPPEWQPSESTEGSEASASPYEEAQRYPSFDQEQIPFTQMPQQFPLDFGPSSFLFDSSEDEWFTGSVKPTPVSEVGYAGYDWYGHGAGDGPY